MAKFLFVPCVRHSNAIVCSTDVKGGCQKVGNNDRVPLTLHLLNPKSIGFHRLWRTVNVPSFESFQSAVFFLSCEHAHPHRDKVIAISALPCYVVRECTNLHRGSCNPCPNVTWSSNVKASRPDRPRGQNFGLGLGLKYLASVFVNLTSKMCYRVPPGHGKSWNLGRPFSRPGKSWKIVKVMESHGKWW